MKTKKESTIDWVLNSVNKVMPGFGNLFKKLEKSKTFGIKISEIKKELDKKFSGVKK